MGQGEHGSTATRGAYLTAMSAKWSCLAPSPEELSCSDEVQQGLTAGQTFCRWYYSCQNSEAWLLLLSAFEAP